jgi:hypothetical protein
MNLIGDFRIFSACFIIVIIVQVLSRVTVATTNRVAHELVSTAKRKHTCSSCSDAFIGPAVTYITGLPHYFTFSYNPTLTEVAYVEMSGWKTLEPLIAQSV